MSSVQLNTLGRIAAKLGSTKDRIAYIVRTRQHINNCAVAGRVRLYDEEAVAQIRHELNAMDARRGGIR